MKSFYYPSRKNFFKSIGKTPPIKFSTFESERDWGTILGTKETLKLLRNAEPSLRINQGKNSDINVFDANNWSLLLTGNQNSLQPMSARDRAKWLKNIAESNGYKLEILGISELETFGQYGKGTSYEIQFIFYQKRFKPVDKKRSGAVVYNWDKWLEAIDFLDEKVCAYSNGLMRTRDDSRTSSVGIALLKNIQKMDDMFAENSGKFPVNYKINGNYQTLENYKYELEEAINENNLTQVRGIALKINTYSEQLKNDMLKAKDDITTWKSVIKASIVRRLGRMPRNLYKFL